MITRGIVEKIYSKNSVAVRVPLFDKSATSASRTPTESLGVASICILPNSIPNVRVGDVVYVGFENNDISKPVIIGYVYIDREYLTKQGLSLETIDVSTNALLPVSTRIGNITPEEIATLSGIKSNIQEQINFLIEEINELKSNT